MPQIDWSPVRLVLLETLLGECEAESRHCVPRDKFRKRNFSEVQEIEALVRQGFILDHNAQYSVNVLCLIHLESELALKILDDANSLWCVYRAEYLRDESESVFLSSVAKAAEVGMPDAQRALHYMMQTNWHRGYAFPAGGLYDSVVIGEDVLRYDSFFIYLEHLYQQHVKQPRWSGSFDASRFVPRESEDPFGLRKTSEGNLPPWVSELPEGLAALLKETYQAKAQGWNRLTAMGIRTLFDMISVEALSRDAKTFKEKLDEMVREEHLVPTQRENLHAMVEAGNAAAHRGFNPPPEMVDTMWEIALNALHSFVLRRRAEKLKDETPARPSRSSK